MGSGNSCFNCFTDKNPQNNSVPQLETPYAFAPMPSEVKDSKFDSKESKPEKPEQSEHFSKAEVTQMISSCEEKFLKEIQTSPLENGYENVLDKAGFEVYCKDLPEGFIMLSKWKVPYDGKELLEFMKRSDIRKAWDKNIEEARKICDVSQDISVYYQLFKKMLMTAQRDMLVVTKLSKTNQGWLDVSTSIDSSLLPACDNVVRARLAIGGYFMQPMTKDSEGNITQVFSLSEAYFGGNFPKSMIKKMSVTMVPKFAKSMIEGFEKFSNK